jgi:anti-sigma B factor antagonist
MEIIMSTENPKIAVEYVGDIVIATLNDERILDGADIERLESSLMPLIEQTANIHLVLDFSVVKFLSSAVLGLLIRINDSVAEAKGELRLCSIEANIIKIFAITRLDKIFDIYVDSEEAIASFTD